VTSKAAALLQTNKWVGGWMDEHTASVNITSLSFEARELKFCMHTSYVSVTASIWTKRDEGLLALGGLA